MPFYYLARILEPSTLRDPEVCSDTRSVAHCRPAVRAAAPVSMHARFKSIHPADLHRPERCSECPRFPHRVRPAAHTFSRCAPCSSFTAFAPRVCVCVGGNRLPQLPSSSAFQTTGRLGASGSAPFPSPLNLILLLIKRKNSHVLLLGPP